MVSSAQLARALRSDLQAAGFETSKIEAMLGAEALQLLKRGVASPAYLQVELAEKFLATQQSTTQQSTAQPSSAQPPAGHFVTAELITLTKLFVTGQGITVSQAEAAFKNSGLQNILKAGYIKRSSDKYIATVSLTAHRRVLQQKSLPETIWLLSDLDDHLRQGPVAADHVMGVGGATLSLLKAIPSIEGALALDLGTGNGVLAIEIAPFFERVVASDISARALEFAAFNAALNGLANVECVHSHLFAGIETSSGTAVFDLIVSNPPFVIEPAATAKQYRSSVGQAGESFVGDALLRQIIAKAPEYLRPDGVFVGLANWEHELDIDESPAAVWLIERGCQDTLDYVETWLRDSGQLPGTEVYEEQRRVWIHDFLSRGIKRINYGYVFMRNTQPGLRPKRHELLAAELVTAEALQQAANAFGVGWHSAMDCALRFLALSDAEQAAARLVRSAGVFELRTLLPGTDDIVALNLATQQGISRQFAVDTLAAALVGVADGELTLAQTATGLANIFAEEHDVVFASLKASAIELLWSGVLQLL